MIASAWPGRQSSRPRSVVGLLTALTVVTALVGSGCSTAEITYQPPFSPVILGIDSRGNVSVKAEASVVTFIGKFGVGSTVFSSVQPEPGTTLVVVRHVQDGVQFDSAYRLNTAMELVAELAGRTEVRVSDRRVFVDASSGAIRRIEIRPTTPVSQAPPVTVAPQAGVPGDVLLADSLSSSSPSASSSIACRRKPDGVYVDSGNCSLAELPPGDIDISVTVEWRGTNPGDKAALGLSDYPSDVLYRISRDGTWSARGISGDIFSQGRSSIIGQRQNRIGMRLRGQGAEFVANGSRVGRYRIEEKGVNPNRYISLHGS